MAYAQPYPPQGGGGPAAQSYGQYNEYSSNPYAGWDQPQAPQQDHAAYGYGQAPSPYTEPVHGYGDLPPSAPAGAYTPPAGMASNPYGDPYAAQQAPTMPGIQPSGYGAGYAANASFPVPSRPGTAPGSANPAHYATPYAEEMPNFSQPNPPPAHQGRSRGMTLHDGSTAPAPPRGPGNAQYLGPSELEGGDFVHEMGSGDMNAPRGAPLPGDRRPPLPQQHAGPRRPDLGRTRSNDTYRSDPGPRQGNGPISPTHPNAPPGYGPPAGRGARPDARAGPRPPPGMDPRRGPPRDPRRGPPAGNRPPPASRPPPGSRGAPRGPAPPGGSDSRDSRSRDPRDQRDPRDARSRSRGPPREGSSRGAPPPRSGSRPPPGAGSSRSGALPGRPGGPPGGSNNMLNGASRPVTGAGHRADGPTSKSVIPGATGPPGRRNSDALPAHPAPVRPGLPNQASDLTQGGPLPTRQKSSSQGVPAGSSGVPVRKPVDGPVTHEELARLRQAIQQNPRDHKTRLLLAKKLVEAALVLADEGGKADVRTRNKNREKYVGEASTIVKDLVAENYPEAQFYLADCMGSGVLGIPNDSKAAFALYQSAAKSGHAQAAYRTAVCCEIGPDEGGGTRKDTLKAFQWYKRAAALGDMPSMYKVAIIQLRGLLDQERNMAEGVTWLKRAVEFADEDNPHAMYELACLYDSAAPAPRAVGPDDARALQLFTQSSNFGFKHAQFRLGQAYEYGLLGCPIDARNSIIWYTKAAAQGEHQSELALSGWYLTGAEGILEHSDTEAYLWARKAALAEPPLAKAMFALGYYTEVGIGCPRSLEEAKRWYSRAAAHKFTRAQERLDELKRGGTKVQKSRENLARGTNQKQQEAECSVM